MKFKLSDFDSEVEMLEVINEQHGAIQQLQEENRMLKTNVKKLSGDVRFLARLEDNETLKHSKPFKVMEGSEALQLDNIVEHYGFGFPFEWEDSVNRFCEYLNRSFLKLMQEIEEQHGEIQHLKQELFEAKTDYLIETMDISDKLHLDEDIKELKQEIFGDDKE